MICYPIALDLRRHLRVGRDGRPLVLPHGVLQLHAGHLHAAHAAPRQLHGGLAVQQEAAEAAVGASRRLLKGLWQEAQVGLKLVLVSRHLEIQLKSMEIHENQVKSRWSESFRAS